MGDSCCDHNNNNDDDDNFDNTNAKGKRKPVPVDASAPVRRRRNIAKKDVVEKEEKKPSGLNWKALAFLLLFVVPGVLGAIFGAMDYFGFNASSPSARHGTKWTPQATKARLVEFYKRHNPDKLSEVDKLLRKYKGREEEMFQVLRERYGD